MKEAPIHIVQEIQRIDPNLRVRWSREKRKFVIERKVDVLHRYALPRPVIYRRDGYGRTITMRCPEFSERYIAYHDGYLPIMTVPEVDARIPKLLRASDSRRFGPEGTIQGAERGEAAFERRKDYYESEMIKDIAGESYDRLHWRQGERMAI